MLLKKILAAGLNRIALREASASEFNDVISLVRDAVRAVVSPGNTDRWIDVDAIYPDRVVVREQSRLFAYAYSIDDNNLVTVGAKTEVVREHNAVAMREAVFVEAADDTGAKWLVRVIRAGLSKNKNHYPDAVLRESVALFEGVRVFEKSDEEHIKGKGKSTKNLLGVIRNPKFIKGAANDTGEIQATFHILETAGDTPAKIREAFDRGLSDDMFGFSIDADGTDKAGKGRRIATKITKVNSLDFITEPAAGGQLINLIEAVNPEEQQEMTLRARMIEAVEANNNGSLPEGLDVDDETQLLEAYDAVRNEPASAELSDAAVARIEMIEARATMREAIAGCNLPSKAKTKLLNQFKVRATFKEADVHADIKDEREYLASLSPNGVDDGSLFIEAGEDRSEKVEKMFDDFFTKKPGGPRSFKECYISVTGDKLVTGHMKNCDVSRMREALGGSNFLEALNSASWADALGDSIARRMVALYNTPDHYDVYKHLVTVGLATDFRTQERTRIGGYGDLPTVAEDGAYTALSSPSDEKSTYAVGKKGGTETVSLEMVKNDDVAAIRRIPVSLSRAAKRTLSKFVLDFIATNPTLYDAVAWFHATHNNLGTAALDATSLAAGRLAMLKQTEAGSADRLGIPPMHLWVPADLEEAAHDLFRRATNNDTDFIESLQMQVHPVWYWTDANDWAITADVNDIPVVELGFLDGNEDPEIFVQDAPNQGSLFSNDQILYKIRHIYGGNVLDFRGGYKAVVV